MSAAEKVVVGQDGAVLIVAINRPDKANAVDADVIAGLARAYVRLSDDPSLRVAVVHSRGEHFTGALTSSRSPLAWLPEGKASCRREAATRGPCTARRRRSR
ncbi:enoyl-CoA hydratase-related protein [Krasilnikovia sp. M28-CT-15]|uniref:enoyl-CoA hydratase-related protein n=1 Tax=Krasilnikovia sp. M28-CT-15 TaxID=3373540 RepID=UPI0038771D7C